MEEFRLSPARLSELARSAGFDLAGIAPAPPPLAAAVPSYFADWVENGRAGEMEYLKRRNEGGELLRSELHVAFPWAESVIVCAANYNAAAPRSVDPAAPQAAWIARYAWSGEADPDTGELRPSDYHDVLLARLRVLEAALQRELGPFESRAYVDTGPVVERVYAERAGIGWIGKNTCTLNQQLGSWLLLGVIVTSLTVPPEAAAVTAADRCGSCRRCIEACPTGALVAAREMDASRCISYLTIEKRGSIPEELRAPMGRQVFGCDICQEVCPWNRRAPVAVDPSLSPRPELINPGLDWLAGLDPQAFNRLFRGSPIKRARHVGMRRNVAIAMGNSGLPEFLPRLREWAARDDRVLAETAAWAMARIESASSHSQKAANTADAETTVETPEMMGAHRVGLSPRSITARRP